MTHNDLEKLNERVERAALQHSQELARLAFTYVKQTADAEDIVQDVFLAYLRTGPEFRDPEGEKAWLIRCTINRSKDVLKAGWFRNREPIPEDLSYLPKEEHKVLQEVLALDAKYRLPIHLYYYGGYSIKEIAAFLGEKETTIGSRLARGRRILHKKLGGFEDE
ncbi:MAG: sigma-70 family RNA polymerase sigma factor [Firmicutes bacterium]|nr:sigma-70 family RNA polymerase sigma factor [Bacillota bacterium]